MCANINSISDAFLRDNSTLNTIWSRRSIGRLAEPGPTAAELQKILEAGSIAPDHDVLRPFRFVVLIDDAIEGFGEILAASLVERLAAQGMVPTEGQIQKEKGKLRRAPLVIAVGAKIDPDAKVPEIEQYAAAVAAAENILLAATSMGYGSMWRTGGSCYDPKVKAQLGLESSDYIVGWLYIGSMVENAKPLEYQEPNLEGLVTYWRP